MSAVTKTGTKEKACIGNCLPDLPLDRLDLPQVRPVFSYPNAVASALERLSGIRLRLTLCRLVVPCGRRVSLKIAAAIDDPALIADVASDGSILVLAIGPRLRGAPGDKSSEATIAGTLLDALARFQATGPRFGGRLAVLHCWADALDSQSTLLNELLLQPTQPLTAIVHSAR